MVPSLLVLGTTVPTSHWRISLKNVTQYILLVALLGLAAMAPAQETAPPTEDINPAVLKVNDDTIYAAEISWVMSNIAGQLGGRDNVPDNQQLLQMATQRVVEQKLLAQEARRFGIEPNEERVATMLETAEQQSGGREALEASLERRGSSYERLVATLTEMDLVRTFVEEKISPTIQVSDEEVSAFYNDHPEVFVVGEQVHARHIVFAAAEGVDADTEKSAREKAEKAHARAAAGEDFASLARELSEGPTASKGGDLGFFARDQMVPVFADAAFALEAGEISGVVHTSFGFHVIKVEERRPSTTQPIEEASARIRTLLVQQKTGQSVGAVLESLTANATIEPLITKSLPAAEAAGPASVPE